MVSPAEDRIQTDVPREVVTNGIPRPVAYRRTRWGKDPYALCSYTTLQKGATAKDRTRNRNPLGEVVIFAGEHGGEDFENRCETHWYRACGHGR